MGIDLGNDLKVWRAMIICGKDISRFERLHFSWEESATPGPPLELVPMFKVRLLSGGQFPPDSGLAHPAKLDEEGREKFAAFLVQELVDFAENCDIYRDQNRAHNIIQYLPKLAESKHVKFTDEQKMKIKEVMLDLRINFPGQKPLEYDVWYPVAGTRRGIAITAERRRDEDT